ncbi:DUF4232 domain-containing protein [Streptomyces sp. NPDC058155]|uniref:DUF4232 domain-containing protein n=1 Tax=Streptomyces sp. NPDC058155 TaxID=3346359 RepID=UPI0036EA2B9D
MRNRRIRSAATSTATAATVTALVTALALTACGPSDAVGASPKPDSTAAAASTSTDEPDTKASDKPQPPADQNADDGANSNSTGNGSGSKNADTKTDAKSKSKSRTTTCTGSNTKVTVTEVTRPINHLLVTATNTGSGNCHAYYAPLLGFDDAQSVTQINEDSQPQAVVTLAPGESAYASIALGGDGSPDIAAYKLSVHFAGRDNQGSVGSAANLTLPKGTMISDSTSVSYWQSTMADALTW